MPNLRPFVVGDLVYFNHGYGNGKVASLAATVVHVFEDGTLNLCVLNDGVHCNWDEASRLVRRVSGAKIEGAIGCWSPRPI